MKNLLIIAAPGDEAVCFGGLLQKMNADWTVLSVIHNPIIEESSDELLRKFKDSAEYLGATETHTLGFSEVQTPLHSIELIAEKLTGFIGFDSIYTYNIIEDNLERQITGVAAAKAFKEINIRSMGGLSDIIIKLSEREFKKKLNAINKNYGARIVRRKNISAFEIKDVETYQRYNSIDLVKFYYENFRLPVYDFSDEHQDLPTLIRGGLNTGDLNYPNPWDLKTSEYESDRYKLEFESLEKIKWHKLVEIGACEGHFTEMIEGRFPEREVIATEPNTAFYKALERKLGLKIKVYNKGIQNWDEPCDVLFVSSLLYYVVPFPWNIFETGAKYIVMSHHKLYHEQVVDPIMKSKGYKIHAEYDLEGKIEPMWNVLDTKEGTNIKVWTKK